PSLAHLLDGRPIDPLPALQALIFDIDGVLTYQGRVYPGAVDVIAGLRRRGTALRFLTNSTLKSRASAATRLRERGFDVQDGEFLTASSLSAAYLRARQPRSAWVMVEREGLNEFADFVHDEQNPEYIVVGDNRSRFDFDTLNRALRLLKKGARLIGMTSELIDSSLGELELNVGSWVRLLETASGVPAVYIGKPHPYAFELALASLGLDRDSVLMVGDRPTSDILGANRAGLRSLLVRTGEYTPEELYSSGSRPDFVIDDLRFLPEVLAPYLG
ncbi:MAG: HAD-IIA family hydrolase, partial [Chloroflexota bacterium]